MRRKARGTIRGTRRRAVIAVQVAVAGTAIIGFASLAIDVSAMYNAKGEMQRAADSAAMAAAAAMADHTQDEAFAAAQQYVQANTVLGRSLTVTEADVTFGKAVMNDNGGYDFISQGVSANAINAVRVVVRHTEESPNHALPLYFAGIFGKDNTELTTEAIAMLVPRDIAIVADLSASHNDDSEIRHYKSTEDGINLHQVWDAFPGGVDGADSVWAGDEHTAGSGQMSGPAWGVFKDLGYGSMDMDATNAYHTYDASAASSYDPDNDPGLVRLAYNQNWSNATIEGALVDWGYSSDEIDALMSSAYDSDGAYKYRVACALGLARWDSGIPGGLWEQMGIPPGDAGNGNNWVGSGETTWLATFGDRSVSTSASIWGDYINSYMRGSSSQMYYANHDFRYQFGIKTFMNYLMENRTRQSQTPEFANAPAQPMQAVKDSVQYLVSSIHGLESEDQISLEVYDTRGRHEVDLHEIGDPWSEDEVLTSLNSFQAGQEDAYTNMGAGILRAREELAGPNARNTARKVMILITDGYANVASEYGSGGNYSGGQAYAWSEAELAADEGIQIFCVSVGSYSDQSLMANIANMGGGQHFHAEGSIDDYSANLAAIFDHLGGVRPVELIK